MAIFKWMQWQCRTDDVRACCATNENEEKLTAAMVQRLDRGESIVPPAASSPPTQRGGQSPLRGGQSPLRVETVPVSARLRTSLQVPPEFDAVKTSPPDSTEQQVSLQGLIRGFTRALLRGVCLNVLLDDGRTQPTGAALDSDLTHLVLHVSNMQHPVALSSIEDLCSPAAVYETRTSFALPVPDDWCLTLVLSGGTFLTLLFEEARLREYFEFCFKVVILAGNRPSGIARPLLVPSELPAAKKDSGTDGFVEKV